MSNYIDEMDDWPSGTSKVIQLCPLGKQICEGSVALNLYFKNKNLLKSLGRFKVVEFGTELGFDFGFGISCHEDIKVNIA